MERFRDEIEKQFQSLQKSIWKSNEVTEEDVKSTQNNNEFVKNYRPSAQSIMRQIEKIAKEQAVMGQIEKIARKQVITRRYLKKISEDEQI